MARRGVQINGEAQAPPPSTLAAQIVQNQTRQSQQQQGEATFHNLLHEILHNPAAAQESDVNVNAQLVSVVTQAGLLPLVTGDPFANWEAAVADAASSLAVIEKTILRQPDVLFVQLSSDGPQLLLGLLATLLNLIGRPKCGELALCPLLSKTIAALDSSIHLWKNARTVAEILQECADDLCSALEALPSPAEPLNVKLPPARSVGKLWPNLENSITMPPGNTAVISDVARAFLMALELASIPGLSTTWLRHTQHRIQRLALKIQDILEKTDSWASCLHKLLCFPQSFAVLSHLLVDCTKSLQSHTVQTYISKALLANLRDHPDQATDLLLPPLQGIGESDRWQNIHEDLRIAVTTWLCRFQPEDALPEQVKAMREALRQDNVMTDNDLQASFQQLSIAHTCHDGRPRPRKRRKLSQQDPETRQALSIERTTELLTGMRTKDLSALSEVAPSVYVTLAEDDKCSAWQCLVDLAEFEVQVVAQTISRLIQLEELHNTKRPRILSMLAIRACVQRSSDPLYTSLGSSEFGNYCLKAIYSSVRELRLTAAQSLPAFLRDDLPEDTYSHNRRLALESLRNWSDRDIASEQETLIAAWGQVGIACGKTELNLVLLRLVDYLGHRNTLVCALAFAEIEAIAAAREQSILSMFQPFWKSVAVSVVQDLTVKPHKVQQLSDLLGMTVNKFLDLTQKETLPTLVLTKRTDILQRVAVARGISSIRDLCTQPFTNLAAIVTFLLNQSSGNIADAAFACLTAVDPGFKVTDLAGLIRMDAVLIACEMLKHCGEEIDSRKSRAYQAFQTMANIEQSSPGQQRAHAKASRAVTSFFDKYLLGILTHFSTRLEESGPSAESMLEKTRCVKAMAELFTLTKGSVSSALPQIRATLQSGLEQPELCELAFSAWLTLLPLLPAEDIANIVDETFVLVVRHWNALSSSLHQRTHETISQLVKDHNTVLQENIMTLPSLGGIPLLSKFAAEFDRLKNMETVESHCKAFVKRLRVGTDAVVFQALVELVPFLDAHQDFVHESAASEHPSQVLSDLLCALLDATVKYSSINEKAADLCGQALGIIGSLDPNRVEASRKKRQILVLSNFEKETETVDWVMALLEDVLAKSFKSATNVRAQGFLAFTMQELLRACGLGDMAAGRTRASQGPYSHQRWEQLPEAVQTTLTPFLSSRYVITSANAANIPARPYPNFDADAGHGHWLRSITCDLMFKAKGDNAKEIFPLLARTIRGSDLAIARFVFPFAVLNVVLGGTVSEVQGIADEFLAVLRSRPSSSAQQECIRLCSETVFTALDHLSTWLTEKRKELSEIRNIAYKTGHSPNELEEARDMGQIDTIENFLAAIPAEVIANQAIDCRSYARALFHWEQYIRQERPLIPSSRLSEKDEIMYDRLQDIYAQIDEPDGLEGIAAHLPIISEEQQAFNHAKAGRWTAAQAWYELQLGEHPQDVELQHRVLKCLRETGQHAPLLKYANTFLSAEHDTDTTALDTHLPLATEACWMTEDFATLERLVSMRPSDQKSEFNVSVGSALAKLQDMAVDSAIDDLRNVRKTITESLSMAGTDSLQNCHDELLKLHVVYELKTLMTADTSKAPRLLHAFDKRLNAVGSYMQDKQYVLGIRRAAMRFRQHGDTFTDPQIGSMWLTTARLARKAGNISSAYNAVLKAAECGEQGAKLEQARLLWHDGHQRQAIQSLEAAINSGAFTEPELDPDVSMGDPSISMGSVGDINGHKQDMLAAKALLTLAKWLDASGQSQTKDMTDRYQLAARRYQRWEKGHYYLGKHYSKLLDAQKALPKAKQSQPFLTGELAKLVIDNQLRSIPFGTKYWHQTIPRVLTLWLEMGMEAMHRGKDEQTTYEKRIKCMQNTNRQIQKYFERVPSFVFYQALPQLISRITHPHPDVWKQLCNILIRIASSHPNQALWSLLAVIKANDKMRSDRGLEVLAKLKDPKNKPKGFDSTVDLRTMISHGQRLCEGLLQASERPVDPRAVQINLAKDLAFNHKLAPSQLVVPIEATLTASAPPASTVESIRKHKAFAQDKITIARFEDDVLVLNSLQRPRKITIRGSDGKLYGLLCKPKDDLRKDQRLMEFNGIINRALKRDTESSKRRLYIKTYAVTPLSEESGCIEWVEGIKPTRDILLNLYNRKGIRPNYTDIRKDLDYASAAPENGHVFAEKVLVQFPPVLHEWFTETYPEPDTWFAARLRYSRTAAVMSMVGHILGLGDRHGENILLEEGTGGVFHVDFNCLFDKGLTFEKPEMVPFRLTHNMQDAMGPYSHEGPFRKSSELTLSLLRQEKDTLMTVLETFLYDPTTDFVGKKKKSTAGVPETPQEILESVSTKLNGLLRGETVPLSVEGYVDALIQEATSHFRLASMYIGWCSFL